MRKSILWLGGFVSLGLIIILLVAYTSNKDSDKISELIEMKTKEKVISMELKDGYITAKTDQSYYQVIYIEGTNDIEIIARLPYFDEGKSAELLGKFLENQHEAGE